MPIYESHANLRMMGLEIARPRHVHAIRRFALKRAGGASGFTIIELLVVVAVIALIVSVVTATLSTARAKSRDTKREQDMKTIQNALAIYAANARVYPQAANGLCLTGQDAVSQELIAAGAIAAIPLDPLHRCGATPEDPPTAVTPHYHYTSVDGTNYAIVYYLETNTIPGKSAGVQPPVTP